MTKGKVTKKRLLVEAARATVFANDAVDIMKQLLVERTKYDILVDELIEYCTGLRNGTVILAPGVPEIFGKIHNYRMTRLDA